MIDKQLEYIKMAAAEKKLWWYKALHFNVIRVLDKHNVSKDAAILDAGCGTGGMMEQLFSEGYTHVNGIDFSPNAIKFCNERGLKVIHDDVSNCHLHFPEGSQDVIVSNDLLCYIDADAQRPLLVKYASLLKKDGLLIMNLPALKAFYGIHDISVGLKQRFGPKELKMLSGIPGMKLISKRYWPFALSPLIYGIRLNQRRKLKSSHPPAIESDVHVPSDAVNNLLYGLTKTEFRMFNYTPFGSSLFVVLKRTDL